MKILRKTNELLLNAKFLYHFRHFWHKLKQTTIFQELQPAQLVHLISYKNTSQNKQRIYSQEKVENVDYWFNLDAFILLYFYGNIFSEFLMWTDTSS